MESELDSLRCDESSSSSVPVPDEDPDVEPEPLVSDADPVPVDVTESSPDLLPVPDDEPDDDLDVPVPDADELEPEEPPPVESDPDAPVPEDEALVPVPEEEFEPELPDDEFDCSLALEATLLTSSFSASFSGSIPSVVCGGSSAFSESLSFLSRRPNKLLKNPLFFGLSASSTGGSFFSGGVSLVF